MKLNRLDGKGNMSLEQSVTKQSTVMLAHITRNQGIYLTLKKTLSRRFAVGVGAIFEALGCKSDLSFRPHYGPGFCSASNRINRKNCWGRRRRQMLMIDTLTTFLCRLSGNLSVSTSWKPRGLYRPAKGLFCILRLTNSEIKIGNIPEYANPVNFQLRKMEQLTIFFHL